MILVIPAIVVLVGAAIAIHYETLRLASRTWPGGTRRPRLVVIGGVGLALVAHVLEVWVFAIGYFLLSRIREAGTLGGEFTGAFLDCTYYSFVVYTSLGFGDVTPEGPIRLLTGMEALTGLVLVAWTASFMFLQLRSQWTAD